MHASPLSNISADAAENDDISSASDENDDLNFSDLDDSIEDPTYDVMKDPDYIAHQKKKKYARTMESIRLLISSEHLTILFCFIKISSILSQIIQIRQNMSIL